MVCFSQTRQRKNIKMIKETDLILIHVDEKPGFYARVEDISPDEKPGWWQVSLLVLTFPLQVFTWILDEDQLDEADFTMGGTPMRLEKIISPVLEARQQAEKPSRSATQTGNKVVSLADHRKKR